MFLWLQSNVGTILVGLLLLLIVCLIVSKMRKDKKKGKSSCGCDCKNCALSCHHSLKK
jgi:hypothetical protein